MSRLTALTHATGATTLVGNQYAYNDANNITSWANASGNHAYGYDLVDRLTSANNSAQPNENYAYDGVGNRTASHLSANYSYQPFNKLTSTSNATYVYDNNGNLTSKTDSLGTTTFSWNEENQLKQVTLPSGLTVNYKYDGLGRRIQRTTSAGANERYVYDGRDVLVDLSADWTVATTYLSGPGIDNHLRQTNSATGMSYYLTDHLDSIAALTDVAGNVVEQETYDSFGNSPGSARTRYGYTGRERDPDTAQLYSELKTVGLGSAQGFQWELTKGKERNLIALELRFTHEAHLWKVNFSIRKYIIEPSSPRRAKLTPKGRMVESSPMRVTKEIVASALCSYSPNAFTAKQREIL